MCAIFVHHSKHLCTLDYVYSYQVGSEFSHCALRNLSSAFNMPTIVCIYAGMHIIYYIIKHFVCNTNYFFSMEQEKAKEKLTWIEDEDIFM